MLVVTPQNQTFNVPADTFEVGGFGTSAYPPVLASALMGAVTSGSMNPFRTTTYGYLLVQTDGGTTKIWAQFDDREAAQLAFDNIVASAAADAAAITLNADGTLGS